MRENQNENLGKYDGFDYFSFKAYERFRIITNVRDNLQPFTADAFSEMNDRLKEDFISNLPLRARQKINYN